MSLNAEGSTVAAIREALQTEGTTALKGAFTPEWAQRMREDVEAEFARAIARPGGAIGRGPQRWYVEMHPEDFRGFLDLITHPWVQTVSEAVLGPDYQIVELGFDIPFAGAKHQPWHRDFRSPPETYRDHVLTSLAFNLTCVDTIEEMGPFEIAPGTQWESGLEFDHGMFPDTSTFPHYAGKGVKKYPQLGDISARSALTIHRGTANVSENLSRPVLVLGVDAPGAGHHEFHDMQFTRAFWKTVPPELQPHLRHARIVDELEPIVQQHDIEGLVMGAEE
jgi:ectoine hydroxylase-related dioxygenase (phytanoyl-CoA dioxygenase family)